jgi:hypothetical protein
MIDFLKDIVFDVPVHFMVNRPIHNVFDLWISAVNMFLPLNK